MSVTLISLIGLLATVVSTGVLIPTVVKQIKTKKAVIDPLMVTQALLANVLWVIYGGLGGDTYVLGRALIAGTFSAMSLVLYYKYSTR